MGTLHRPEDVAQVRGDRMNNPSPFPWDPEYQDLLEESPEFREQEKQRMIDLKRDIQREKDDRQPEPVDSGFDEP